MRTPFLPAAAALSSLILLAACGGGDPATPDAGATAAPDATATAAKSRPVAGKTRPPSRGGTTPVAGDSVPPSDAQRAAAAAATATSTTNACAPVAPFYWEVGTATGARASGSVRSATSSTSYAATTQMAVASASKWLYGAYVVERRAGNPSAEDRRYLSMRAGYVGMRTCLPGQTVDACLNYGTNGQYNADTEGRFYYNGGHMQKHASLLGLGAMDGKALANEVRARLGTDIPMVLQQPNPSGGFIMTPAAYGTFLRKVLGGSLRIGGLLGSQAACASPLQCGTDEALVEPMPPEEMFHYTLGHWVEDDPAVGDGAFSSPGAFGFYPWINAGKTHYGIVARVDRSGESAAWASMACGRLIRKAWFSGTAL